MRYRIMLIVCPPNENPRYGMSSIHTYHSAQDAMESPEAKELQRALNLSLYDGRDVLNGTYPCLTIAQEHSR